jgi:hypothetical protein
MSNGNTSDETMGAQTAPAESDSAQAHDAAQQLQASVSQFAQDDEGHQQSLLAVVKQMGAQLRRQRFPARMERFYGKRKRHRFSKILFC